MKSIIHELKIAGKKIFLLVAVSLVLFVQKSLAQANAQTPSIQLLSTYYDLKDALVSSNATMAAANASAFIKALNSIDKEIVKEENRAALLKDAVSISQYKDLNKQRETFANLSANMYVLGKTVKLSAEPIYQQYCPMKKASWLSKTKVIKNPYYGNAMLTCGTVKESF